MLDFLRSRASSWVSKAILGAIALIFALYFGFQSGGPPAGGTAPIAKVNGESIPSALFNQSVQNQLKNFGGNLSADFRKIIEQQNLQGLINNTLLTQAAQDWGIRIADAELAGEIRGNPNFQQDGIFNEEYYLKQFKPYFENQFGQDYEVRLRQELIQERVRKALDQSEIVSEIQVQNQLKLQSIQLKIRKLEISIGDTEKQLPESKANEIATQWIALKKKNASTKKLIEDNKIKEKEIGPQSLKILPNYFGGKEAIAVLTCLTEIKVGEVCPEPFKIKGQVMAVELLEKTEKAPTEEDVIQNLRKQLVTAQKNLIFRTVIEDLRRDAEIESFLK